MIVPVPEAEPAVGAIRLAHDGSAALGVPAHVTILFPFAPPDEVDVAALAALFARFRAFDFALDRVERFEDGLVWLAPRPSLPFADLTAAVWQRWPGYPPYEGVHDEVVPHLTVGHASGDAGLDAAEVEIRTRLPVSGRAEHLTVMTEDDTGRWSVLRRVPLDL